MGYSAWSAKLTALAELGAGVSCPAHGSNGAYPKADKSRLTTLVICRGRRPRRYVTLAPTWDTVWLAYAGGRTPPLLLLRLAAMAGSWPAGCE